MEDNTILVFLGVALCTLIYGAYNGLVVQYPNVLVILLGAVTVYLVLLEAEFRQLKKVAFKVDEEESMLSKAVKELKLEVSALQSSLAYSKTRQSKD